MSHQSQVMFDTTSEMGDISSQHKNLDTEESKNAANSQRDKMSQKQTESSKGSQKAPQLQLKRRTTAGWPGNT